ncbi:hypothetical protein C5S32_12915 [ANME-1 cluster archaeon GoMg1]|nr:hypothetical protein [ANME-1 cluster archaeon GoMg1]
MVIAVLCAALSVTPPVFYIFLIVTGSYLLNINHSKKYRSHGYKNRYLAPFKALLKEKGPRLMLVVAFIWSLTANIDKIGLQNSSPLFWVIAVDIYVALLMLPLCNLIFKEKGIRERLVGAIVMVFGVLFITLF